MAAEESDAPQVGDDIPTWPEWSDHIRRAWIDLRDDRFYGAMGGIGQIFYSARSQYAADHGIPLEPFSTFLMAIDREYLDWYAEQSKKSDEKED